MANKFPVFSLISIILAINPPTIANPRMKSRSIAYFKNGKCERVPNSVFNSYCSLNTAGDINSSPKVFFTYDSDLNPGLCSEHQSYQACNRCIQNLYKTLADCQNSCQNGPLEPTLRAKRGKNSLAVEARHIQNLYRENEYHQIYKRIDTVETPATKTTTTPITTTSTKSVLNLATNNNNFIVQNSNDGIWNDECYDASGGSSSDSGSISGSRPRIDSDELSEIVQQPSSGSDTDSDFVHYKPSYRAYQKNRAGYKQMMKDGSFDGMVKRSPKMFTKRLRL